MKKLDSIPNIPLDLNALNTFRSLKQRSDNGEVLDAETRNALAALSMANQIMNTVMNGGQVDPVFIKQVIVNLNKSLDQPKHEVKKVIKKKKLNNIKKI